MRIGFFQDLNIWTHGGGAQLTDREIIKFGMRVRGHDVDLITPENMHFPNGADLVVFSNVHWLVYNRQRDMLAVAAKFPYVMFHHDYFCRYRLFFPMEEKCKSCVYLPPWRKLYDESILNIFMSPLHAEANFSVMPELAHRPYAFVPSAINLEDYRSKEEVDPIPNTVIGVNVLHRFKGMANILKYTREHPELSFTFAGGKEGEPELPPNCLYVGLKNREELVKLYASHEALIHLPSTPQPMERVPAEYILANRKGRLIVNSLIGLFSWPNTIKDGKVNREEVVRLMSQSPDMFWEAVEKVI